MTTSNGASIPFMITNAQRQRLQALGRTDLEIDAMRPSDAFAILAEYDHQLSASETSQPLGGIEALGHLAIQGATFALPRGRTKGADPKTGKPTFEKGWQNNPHTSAEAIAHAQRGGNVGLLTGKHSANIVALDRDVDYPATIAMLGPLAQTTKIERSNAPGRGKLLYRIEGELPKSAVWKSNPADEHPAAEFLSTGRHAIIPPSEFEGGHYQLVDQKFGILEITPEQADRIWWMITGESLDKTKRNQPEQKTENSEYVQRVRDAWTTQKVFEHFNRNGNGVVEGRTDTRILGNGGLLINDWRWYCHADSVGGDQFDAWAWCRCKKVIDRTDAKMWWDVVDDMADVAGIEKPTPKTKTKASQNTTYSDGSDDSDALEQTDSSKPKQADLLYKLAMNRATFFTGRQDSQVYASVEVDGHRECYRMRSGEFSDWLAYAYYTEYSTTVSAQAAEDCKKLLSFEAKKNIEDVFVRVGHQAGKIYIDLGSAEFDVIEVDETGWRILKISPVHFRRSAHALPLLLPVEHPDPLMLRKFLNINDDDWPLVAAWLVAAFHTRGPFPVLALLSRAGSGKSTALRVLKRIIDPSSAELRSQPNDVRDLFIAASNSWLLAFDNVSHVSPEVSDALCVISTGGGFTRKANYTDSEESVINVQRPIVINGIGDVIARQDLMDRAIVVGTPTIPEGQRRDEQEFWEDFERERPKILGAFLFALSTGLANINNVKLDKKPRMADFAKLAVAAESAYTDTQHSFIETYASNRADAAETIIENSPLGEVLRRLVVIPGYLKLTPDELFDKIEVEAKEYEKSSRGWPSAPNRMKSIIERIAPALERQGVSVSYKRSNGGRFYELRRIQ